MRLDLRDEAMRRAAGLLVDERPAAPREHRPRHETERLIIEVVRSAHYPLSPTEICRAINRSTSPYYINMVRSMAARGLLREQAYQYRRHITARVYSAVK